MGTKHYQTSIYNVKWWTENFDSTQTVSKQPTSVHGLFMGHSQLAPDQFKTLCDRKFSNSYVLSLPLHDVSHLFYAIKWPPLIFEDVRNSEATLDDSNCCIEFHIRTTSHNFVLTRKSVAWISKIAGYAPLYVCVVRPWECCKTCRIWSCNVVLPLHVTCR